MKRDKESKKVKKSGKKERMEKADPKKEESKWQEFLRRHSNTNTKAGETK